MSDNELSGPAGLSQMLPHENGTEIKKIFRLVVPAWHYFVIALVIAMMLAVLYNTYTIPTYRVSSTLLIIEGKKDGVVDNSQFLNGLAFNPGNQNLDNQIMLLSSKALIGRTLDELSFYTDYYHRRLFKKVSAFPKSPIRVIPVISDSLPRDIEFTFKYLGNNRFSLDSESNDYFDLNTSASFGEIINTPLGNFTMELADTSLIPLNSGKIKFIFHSRKKLVESYRKRMRVEKILKTGTMVEVSIEGTNQSINIAFLNKLNDVFLNYSLDKKNEESVRTIQFIDDQLIGISDSLVITENKLQQFRSRNKVMDLSAQGRVIIEQAMSLENQRARLGVEAGYFNYLADYLLQDSSGQVPIAPATIGITDPGLTRLVSDLADLQGEFYNKSLGEKNPLQNQLAQQLRNTKDALRETLNGVKRSNNLAMNEISEQIRIVNAQATTLPVTERQLLGIERKYKLNDALYTFLLEKRAGAQIKKASNMPDNEVIDPSDADVLPVKPKKDLIYLLALMAGTGFPFLWILIADTFNNKVREDEDIMRIARIPISGHIPHSLLKKNTVVLEEPGSQTAEAYRSLLSRMQFFTKEAESPVILVTSSMSEEGKTFSAINLASVYSLIGKNTILVDFDLRKPKIYADFKLGNKKGVSTWLIGKDGLSEIIKQTQYKNLSIIPAGPIPPNPFELTTLKKTDELIGLLKEKYECIIIDSSPVGAVSDAFKLAALADTCILIVRQNMTLKALLEDTVIGLSSREIKSISILVNDLKPQYNRYGYGGAYGNNKYIEPPKR